jgi:hypothetical protein
MKGMHDAEWEKGREDVTPSKVPELMAKVEELEAERAWTQRQHRLWAIERADLVATVNRLRDRVAAHEYKDATAGGREVNSVPAVPLDSELSWPAELEKARSWYERHRQAWDDEKLALLRTLEENKAWVMELEKAKEWFLQQRVAWEEERRSLVRALESCQARTAKLEKTRAKQLQQALAWKKQRADLLRTIKTLKVSRP